MEMAAPVHLALGVIVVLLGSQSAVLAAEVGVVRPGAAQAGTPDRPVIRVVQVPLQLLFAKHSLEARPEMAVLVAVVVIRAAVAAVAIAAFTILTSPHLFATESQMLITGVLVEALAVVVALGHPEIRLAPAVAVAAAQGCVIVQILLGGKAALLAAVLVAALAALVLVEMDLQPTLQERAVAVAEGEVMAVAVAVAEGAAAQQIPAAQATQVLLQIPRRLTVSL